MGVDNMYMVKRAGLPDVEEIARLYEKYLSFYKFDANNKNIKEFLNDRLLYDQSRIYFVTNDNGEYIGFMQLYPLFCSLQMNKTWVLYDLYVDEKHRRNGVAQLLLDKANKLASETNASFIMLSTAIDNLKAQNLYEKNGYKRDAKFYTYVKDLNNGLNIK